MVRWEARSPGRRPGRDKVGEDRVGPWQSGKWEKGEEMRDVQESQRTGSGTDGLDGGQGWEGGIQNEAQGSENLEPGGATLETKAERADLESGTW